MVSKAGLYGRREKSSLRNHYWQEKVTPMNKIVLAASLATLLSAGTNGFAADAVIGSDPAPAGFDESRLYVSGFVGATFIDDNAFENVVTGTSNTVALEFDTGIYAGGAIGKDLGEYGPGNLRGELEISYLNSDVSRLDFSGNGASPDVLLGDPEFSSVNLAANLLIDLPTGGAITPYFGAGLGVAFTSIEAAYGPGVALDDSDTNFLLQGIVGASASINETTELFVEGKYTRIFDVESQRVAPTGAITGIGNADFDTVSVVGGLRFRLN